MSHEDYQTYNMQIGGEDPPEPQKKKVHPFVWVLIGLFFLIVIGLVVCTTVSKKVWNMGKEYMAEEMTVAIKQAYNNPVDYQGDAEDFDAMLIVVEDHLDDFNSLVEDGSIEFDELMIVSDDFTKYYTDSTITIDEAEKLLEKIVIINEKHGR